MSAPTAIATEDQYRVLRRYAGGADIASIARALEMAHDRVSGIVSTGVGFNRNFARTLVEDWERDRRAGVPFIPPAAAVVAKSKPAPEKPRITVELDPDDVLARAVKAGDPKLTRLAGKARGLLAEIEERLAVLENAAEAAAEVADLETKLEQARAKLREAKGVRPTQPAQSSTVDAKAVRRWAAENGVSCNAKGHVNRSVIDAYLAAQGSS